MFKNDNNNSSGNLNDFRKAKGLGGPDYSKRILKDIVLLAENIAKEENRQSSNHYDKQMFNLIENLCFCYVREDDDGRKAIRNFIHEIKGGIQSPELIYVVPGAIYAFIRSVAKKIRTKEEGWLLEIGLAAASIEEGRMDFRDLFVSLKELLQEAQKSGIDSAFYVKSMIGKSGDIGAKLLDSFSKRKTRGQKNKGSPI